MKMNQCKHLQHSCTESPKKQGRYCRFINKNQMVRSKIIIVIAFLFIAFSSCKESTFVEQLSNLQGVVEVNEINIDTTFSKQYELYFEQPLDHKNPKKGTFKQRVLVSHKNENLPVVAVLEGYRIWSPYAAEPTKILNCNQVTIEHRFFKDSKPDSIPWNKLTIWQAATDQHKIITALHSIYKNNWLTTGISKGGQATMYHRSFYPDDVTACIPYVAPLNFAREDKRIYEFLNSVGTDEERSKIYNFQCLCFDHQEELIELLKGKAKEKKWSFKFGLKKALQYTILEYPFVFWQWGGFTSDDIPQNEALVAELFEHLNRVAGFTFFEDAAVEISRPFFWTALTEIGIYGYETKPFSKYLGDTTNFTFDFTAPKGVETVYNLEAMQKVKQFLDADGSNMLYIVGGLDTWGATSYEPSGKNNSVRMILPDGHHRTRIKDFPKKDREYMYSLLEEWMQVEIEDVFE